MEHFGATLALVGIVIIVASLLSGVLDRSGVPLVAVFLGLGAALGPLGLGLVDITLETPTLQVLATLALVLVLFTDAVTLETTQVRSHRALGVRAMAGVAQARAVEDRIALLGQRRGGTGRGLALRRRRSRPDEGGRDEHQAEARTDVHHALL